MSQLSKMDSAQANQEWNCDIRSWSRHKRSTQDVFHVNNAKVFAFLHGGLWSQWATPRHLKQSHHVQTWLLEITVIFNSKWIQRGNVQPITDVSYHEEIAFFIMWNSTHAQTLFTWASRANYLLWFGYFCLFHVNIVEKRLINKSVIIWWDHIS